MVVHFVLRVATVAVLTGSGWAALIGCDCDWMVLHFVLVAADEVMVGQAGDLIGEGRAWLVAQYDCCRERDCCCTLELSEQV